jgi:hypothetical protein
MVIKSTLILLKKALLEKVTSDIACNVSCYTEDWNSMSCLLSKLNNKKVTRILKERKSELILTNIEKAKQRTSA